MTAERTENQSSELQPYWYQDNCLAAINQARVDGKQRALVIMASGLGKTAVAAFDVRNYLQTNPGRVLYLCHQNDILRQANTTFTRVLESDYSYGYLHGKQKDLNSDILFASFQTMQEWRDKFREGEFDYIVVDESHHSPAETYLPTLEYFRPKFLLGLTATPERTDLQDIRELYGNEIFSLPLEDGLALGLLTPVDYRLVTDEIHDVSSLKTPIGRLSIKQLNRMLFIPKRDEEIARIITEKTVDLSNPRIIIFGPSIEYCNRFSKILPNAAAIHSDLSDEQQTKILQKFRDKRLKTLITVDKFNEGIDIPDVNVIVFLRSTASRTLFFQQLGRGLRISEGKDKVIILDFAGNCERLEMVNKFWVSVRKKHEYVRENLAAKAPVELDIGDVNFSEQIFDVLDLIGKVRQGYTQEVLVGYLRELAGRLGRSPTMNDINLLSKKGLGPSASRFQDIFGSFNSALEIAGLSPNKIIYSDSQLLKQLLEIYKLRGKISYVDIIEANKSGDFADAATFRKKFGSLSNILQRLGIPTTSSRGKTDDELLDELKNYAEKIGKTPNGTDMNRADRSLIASSPTFVSRFGSLEEAYKLAGLEEPNNYNYSDQELIDKLVRLGKEKGRIPRIQDIDQAHKDGDLPSSKTYYARFGSFANALTKAGFSLSDQLATMQKTDEELISDLKSFAKEIGRTPGYKETITAKKRGRQIASVKTYVDRFGSFRNALKAAGLVKEE